MNNNTSYETQAIDLSLLSVLDITKEGKVVSVEKWVELWTLVFQHINKIDAFCVDMQATLDNWHASEVALNEIIEDMQMKYASLSTGFTHYGEAPPQNPHIKFWVRRMEDIATHCFITNADIDKTYTPTSPNAQSGIAVAEALSEYVVAEVGKGLSTNDFTDEDKEKLGSALQADDISDKMDKFGTVELDGTRLGDVTASVKNFQLLNLTGESGLGLGVHEARLHSKEAAILSKLNTETGDSTEVAVGDGIVNLSSGKDDVILNGVATPTDDNHGTNKQYVDEAVAEAVGVANDYTDKAIKSSKTYANNTFAPAIKNTVSGSVLAVHDVSPVEHNLEVRVKSKNILPYPYEHTTRTHNGITFTDNGDGTITAKGTATGNAEFYLVNCSKIVHQIPECKDKSSITIGGCPDGASSTTYYIYDLNNGHKHTNGEYLIGNTQNSFRCKIVIVSGITVDNIVFKPQIEFVNHTNETTPYTPYVSEFNNISVSRLGKNLFDSKAFLDGVTSAADLVRDIEYSGRNCILCGTGDTKYGDYTVFRLKAPAHFISIDTYSPGEATGSIGTHDKDGNSIQYMGISKNADNWTTTFISSSKEIWYISLYFNTNKLEDRIYIDKDKFYASNSIVKEPITPYVCETATANADGSVDGLTSLSPNMTVVTDTDGVTIDMTYNADTKMYIDNKLAEISAAIVNS